MGPYRIGGVPEGVHSEIPLVAGRTEPGGFLRTEDWRPALAEPPPWIVGRIPFGTEEDVAAVVAATEAFTARNGPPRALLGAERIFLPFDASLVMAAVRGDLAEAGWDATLLSQDAPRDGRLDATPGALTFTVPGPEPGDVRKTLTVVQLELVRRWAASAPELVYVLSHASGRPAAEREGERLTWLEQRSIGAGFLALDPFALVLFGLERIHTGLSAPSSPEAPALLVTTGCQVGAPDNHLIGELFRGGWVAAVCCSTTDNGPLPPIPSIRAERNIARHLASGLPVGDSLYANIDAYLRESAWDPVGLALLPWAKPMRGMNALSYLVYGDPSLFVPGRVHSPTAVGARP